MRRREGEGKAFIYECEYGEDLDEVELEMYRKKARMIWRIRGGENRRRFVD